MKHVFPIASLLLAATLGTASTQVKAQEHWTGAQTTAQQYLPGTPTTPQQGIVAPMTAQPTQEFAAQPAQALPVDLVFCVDGSGSMDEDLIQAKQLMRGIVQQFSGAPIPVNLRIGLIEYGSMDDDYKVLPLTADVNKVYNALVVMDTDMGGSEWVGRVIQRADQEMKWRPVKNTFRAIYVLGNETAAQGEVDYRESVPQAAANGIVVNAVQCEKLGDGAWGADSAQTWQEIAALGGGSYFHYRLKGFTETLVGTPSAEDVRKVQEKQLEKARLLMAARDMERAKMEKLVAINDVDSTVLNYGPMATFWSGYRLMSAINKNLNGSSLFAATLPAKLNTFQSNKGEWDLVDALRTPDFDIRLISTEQLPFEMRAMNDFQKVQYIRQTGLRRMLLAATAGVTT